MASLIRLTGTTGLSAAMLSDIPRNVRITVRIKPAAGVKSFGLFCHGEDGAPNGTESGSNPGLKL